MPNRSASAGSISRKLKAAFLFITLSILILGSVSLYFLSRVSTAGGVYVGPHSETARLVREEIRETTHLMELFGVTRSLIWWDRAQQPLHRALLHTDDGLRLTSAQNNDSIRRELSAAKAALMRYGHAIQRTREVTEAVDERGHQLSLGADEIRGAITALRTALLEDISRQLPAAGVVSSRNGEGIRVLQQQLIWLEELSAQLETTLVGLDKAFKEQQPGQMPAIGESLAQIRGDFQRFQPEPEAGARVWRAAERAISGLRTSEHELSRLITALRQAEDIAIERIAATEDLLERLDRIETNGIDAGNGTNPRQALLSSVGFAQGAVSLLVILSALMSLIIGFVLNRDLSATLGSLAGSLRTGTDQIDTATKIMAAGSAQLVQNASDQAAGLQQTVLAVNQMIESSEKTVRRTRQSDEYLRQTGTAASSTAEAVQKLQNTIDELGRDAAKIAHAVKAVDDLVSQTKVMALSTAIEAARAGEAGRSLMVVSLELGELAQRSIEAAQVATGLASESRVRADAGVSVASDAVRHAEQTRQSAGNLSEQFAGVSKDISYQRMTMGQVSDIIKRLDRSVENNASIARESAASAEVLTAQNGNLRSVMEDASQLAGGASRAKSRGRASKGDKNKGSRGGVGDKKPADGLGIEMVSAGGTPPVFVPAK